MERADPFSHFPISQKTALGKDLLPIKQIDYLFDYLFEL